jgi:O-antigen ligase
MAIYYLKEFMNSLMIGIEVGIIVNFFLVMYEWYQYLHGNIYRSFILTRYFPNAKVQSAYMSNAFRGIGLFSEPGHLARYLAVFILVTFGWFFNKNKKNAILILLLGSITIATTRSTVIVYYLIGIFAIILINSNNSKKTFLTTVVLMVFGIFSLYLAINYIPILHSLWELFSYGFIDLSTAILGQDNSSAIRQEGMKSAVELIKEYPIIGVGWNEFTTHMIMEGYYTESVRGSYSALLQMLAQIGIGTFTYVLFIINNAIDRIRTHDIKQACFGVALLVYFVIFSTTDFGYKDSVAILFGILTVYIGDENYDYYENTV